MTEIKFHLEEDQVKFLDECKRLGFKDKSSLVRTALDYFRKQLDQKNLEESANLYAELYAEDIELQKLTESALSEWPE